MTREEEKEWDREIERESARFGGGLRLSLLRMCLEWTRGRAESTFTFMWLGEKAGQKGWQLQTHTHTLTHPHSLILTRVERDTHSRGTWEHLVKSKSIHQSVRKNTTNIAPLRTMSGEFYSISAHYICMSMTLFYGLNI